MSAQPTGVIHAPVPTGAERSARPSRVTSTSAWRELARQSFGVLSHVNAAGEPRSSGVVYELVGHHLYIAVAPDGWKAREVETGSQVSMTVPVRRGGILSLVLPIPPATISFHARVAVHPAGSQETVSLSKDLAQLIPEARRASAVVFELVPEGLFLTYGIGVSLTEMRDPAVAVAHVPVEEPA
jgi:hypothetical protein